MFGMLLYEADIQKRGGKKERKKAGRQKREGFEKDTAHGLISSGASRTWAQRSVKLLLRTLNSEAKGQIGLEGFESQEDSSEMREIMGLQYHMTLQQVVNGSLVDERQVEDDVGRF